MDLTAKILAKGILRLVPLLVIYILLYARYKSLRGDSLKQKWNIKDIFVLNIILFFFNVLSSLFLQRGYYKGTIPVIQGFVWFPIISTGIYMSIIILYFFIKKTRLRWEDYGFRFRGIMNWNITSAQISIVYIGFMILIHRFIPKDEFSCSFLLSSPFYLIISITGIGFFAPLVEEIFCRGLLFPPVKQLMGPWQSIVLVAFIFALNHLKLMGISEYILFVLFCYLYYRSNSIIPSFILHSCMNLISLLLDIYPDSPILPSGWIFLSALVLTFVLQLIKNSLRKSDLNTYT